MGTVAFSSLISKVYVIWDSLRVLIIVSGSRNVQQEAGVYQCAQEILYLQ